MCMGITDAESLHLQTQHCKSTILQKKKTLSFLKKKTNTTRTNEIGFWHVPEETMY